MMSDQLGEQRTWLLDMNKNPNKTHVVMKKILRCHPNIDMTPLFELDLEEGERNLKGLPYVINWFDRAKVAVEEEYLGNDIRYPYDVDRRKLSAIYQFAQAMPSLFVPVPHVKGDDKKRKRNDA